MAALTVASGSSELLDAGDGVGDGVALTREPGPELAFPRGTSVVVPPLQATAPTAMRKRATKVRDRII
jgi:hypothetical protein